MFSLLQSALLYLLLPVGAIIAGGFIATLRTPNPRVQSIVQHLAAGVVFAAVAVELLPAELNEHQPLPLIVGFGAGVALMLGLEWAVQRWSDRKGSVEVEGDTPTENKVSASLSAAAAVARNAPVAQEPIGLLVIVAVDLLIDGLLIGIGFAVGAKQGVLITIALTIEVLFIGLSVAAEFADIGATRGRIVAFMVGLAASLALGAVIGLTLLAALAPTEMAIVLAFGSAALLYLVIEELLVEAHKVRDTPFTVATFFLGFLLLLVIDMIS